LRLKKKSPWTEWAEEEACQLVLTTPSFRVAEERFHRLTGAFISDTTMWRMVGPAGREMLEMLEGEEAASNAPVQAEEEPWEERVEAFDPLIGQQANVSIDGTTVCVREEGWKEVKGVTVSAVERVAKKRNGRQKGKERRQGETSSEPEIGLFRHTYRMRLAEAEAFALVQGAEADRRRVQYARDLSCVHDGGLWIWPISGAYYPQAVEVLDWAHGMGNMARMASAAFGEGSPQAHDWLEEVETLLWEGKVEEVLADKCTELPRRRHDRGKKIRNGREYVETHLGRIRYKEFREQGYPIGSGSMESACKNVVGWRMKRGGARWARRRVNPMLTMLGEYHSGRWSERWEQIQWARCA